VIVHQILAGAGPHDAVTAQARAFRARFSASGWGGHEYASFIAPGVGGAVRPRAALDPAPDDLILIHHAAATPRLERLLALPNRRVVVYHNITPPRWLWGVAPMLAMQCAVGREQLPELVAGAALCIGVSEFNAAELVAAGARAPVVVPLLLDLGRLGPPGPSAGEPASPRVLFVGRLSPHKRQDEVIRAFALLRAHHHPAARLTLVGEPVTPAYGEDLRALAERLAPGGVEFERGLDDTALGGRYRTADALLCLSEHEGFCLPLIEALHLGVPVVARRAGAVPETLGDAGLLLEAGDDLAVAAELLNLALSDSPLRDELARRGAARVAAYAPEPAAAALRTALERVAAPLWS
jgi:glycosyltransferase involved in cell wall biosynthesis